MAWILSLSTLWTENERRQWNVLVGDDEEFEGIVSSKDKLGIYFKAAEDLPEELHKPARKHFPRRRVIAGDVDVILSWSAALADLRFIACTTIVSIISPFIDICSKYA
ncbi:hypothetical protein CHS0354_029238 [Potamilus streckersoni]|uniref:Uncharacterized protein n=1 Tax=Potamilus streckersoni TaxID=2493646 RepID=A0AAE0RUH7_9BIVA|nr:hypothetical protein CHS0354_029238 [Potamilus streckersoni]